MEHAIIDLESDVSLFLNIMESGIIATSTSSHCRGPRYTHLSSLASYQITVFFCSLIHFSIWVLRGPKTLSIIYIFFPRIILE